MLRKVLKLCPGLRMRPQGQHILCTTLGSFSRRSCGQNGEKLVAGGPLKSLKEFVSITQSGKGREGMQPRTVCRDLCPLVRFAD